MLCVAIKLRAGSDLRQRQDVPFGEWGLRLGSESRGHQLRSVPERNCAISKWEGTQAQGRWHRYLRNSRKAGSISGYLNE